MSRGRQYALGAFAGLVAVLVRAATIPAWGAKYPFFTFYPAAMLAAWYGGVHAGLVAAVVTSIAAWYFIPPLGFLPMRGWDDVVAWVLFSAVNLLIVGVIESTRRERRRAEDARAAAETYAARMHTDEARYRALAAAIGTMVWRADAEGGITEAQAWGEFTGQQPEQYRGWGWLDAIHPEDRNDVARTWKQAMDEGSVAVTEFRLRHRDGTYRWMGVRSAPILDAAGNAREWVGTFTDTTERRAADETRARLVAIVESSNDAIVGKTLEAIVTSWNAGAERMFGYTAEEMIGQSISRLVPPDRPDEVRAILNAIGRGERTEHYETERVRKDGQRIYVSLNISPIKDASGRIIGASKIARDVSDRKQAEERLQQTLAEREELLAIAERERAAAEHAAATERDARRTAEAARRAKDDFLATVSHELRTPLSPILMWTRMLRQPDMSAERVEHGVDVIERCARSQAQLIEDLLDVSRIVAGKMRLEVRPVTLAPVIERAVDIVRPAAEAKSVRLQMVLDTEVGAILGDGERLQQVVWNLVSNAVKFTPRDGRVQIALQRVDSHVEITVSDSGQGIEPQFLAHVFERFQQAEAGTTRAHGGLGLGLAIVRHIVEAHGGTVHAESPGAGQGALFTVKLPPMMRRTAGVPERRHPTAGVVAEVRDLARLDGLRVLIVDDEPDSNEAVRELLESCGAEVRAADSADRARQVLAGWKPDVLVSDVGMPGEDGYAFIASLRGTGIEVGEMPAVALTAYASREDKVRLLSAGFQAHVPKPVDPAELIAVMASLGRGSGKL